MIPRGTGLQGIMRKREWRITPARAWGAWLIKHRLANKMYIKVADLAAVEKQYGRAIERYEQVAKSSIGNNLMKWSLKEYFFKSTLCLLASNVRSLSRSSCSRLSNAVS